MTAAAVCIDAELRIMSAFEDATSLCVPCQLQAAACLVYLYPFSMLVCIVITANHFIFDAVCGGAALVIGNALLEVPRSCEYVDFQCSVTSAECRTR